MKHPTSIHGIYSIYDLQSHYARVRPQGHFFDKETMRFFKSRISETIYYAGANHILFITSEQGPDGKRKWSIRKYRVSDGDISTVDDFQAFKSVATAKTTAHRLAANAELFGATARWGET